MSEMTNLRKIDISLHYYIKEIVLCDFVEQEEYIPLSLMPDLCLTESSTGEVSEVYEALTEMVPSPTERGRGWKYIDTVSGTLCSGFFDTVSGSRADGIIINGVSEQLNKVVVYDASLNIISSNEYIIDYVDGRVITSGTCAPAYVSYYWNYVSFVDEWSAVEAANPPVVVIDLHGTDKTGYQLGAGKKVTRKVDLHVFATNTAERNDLVETLYNGLFLRSFPMLELPLGTVLDYDGTWYGRRDNINKLETLFDVRSVDGASMMQFENVTSRHVNLPILMTRSRDEAVLSDLNAYRSKLSFDLIYYTSI